MHFDPLILHLAGSESLLANKFYLINTEGDPAGPSSLLRPLSLLLAPGADSCFAVLHLDLILHLSFFGPVFPALSSHRDISLCHNF